jgi:hypothetical protein
VVLTARSTRRRSATEQTVRHLTQAAVSVAHLYGAALYYGTCGFAEHIRGEVYSRPEFLYYWVYYAGMNAPWGVVPICKFLSPSSPVPVSRLAVALRGLLRLTGYDRAALAECKGDPGCV